MVMLEHVASSWSPGNSQRPSAPYAMQAACEEEAAPQHTNGAGGREPEGGLQEQAPSGRLQQVGGACAVQSAGLANSHPLLHSCKGTGRGKLQ